MQPVFNFAHNQSADNAPKKIMQQHIAYPKTAMLLAAGLGTRMRPLTDKTPKPLVKLAGKTLLEYGLDLLKAANIEKVVINCHYLADQIIAFVEQLRRTSSIELVLSDERDLLLDSAGGIIKALPELGQEPFYVLNSDTFWLEASTSSNFLHLAENFNPTTQDMLLLTLAKDKALEAEKGDFLQNGEGQLVRHDKTSNNPNAVIYAGGMIVNPKIFAKAPHNLPHSLNFYFDQALAKKRLYGLNLEADWLSVGSVAMLDKAEDFLKHHLID